MPVQWQTQEVRFGGLDEKTDRASVTPGTLVVAENVVFNEPGRLRKRRGYMRVQTTDDTEGTAIDPDNLFCGVATAGDELVVFGQRSLYSVASRSNDVDGAGLKLRGPLARGHIGVERVSTSKLGDS